MLEVALLGGGFDPISLHHERIADVVEKETGMPTWAMPCYGHLFSKNDRLTDSAHRLNMVNATAQHRNTNLFVPFGWEIEHHHTGSMYETVAQLKAKYPNVKFHIVIGMDNANVIKTKWDRGNLLIQENPFFVFEREGVVAKTNWFMQPPHRLFRIDYDLSSTAIREAIQSGNYAFAEEHLNPAVWEYIKANNLYGYKA